MKRAVLLAAVLLAMALSASAQTSFTATVAKEDAALVWTYEVDPSDPLWNEYWVGNVGGGKIGPFGKLSSYTASPDLPQVGSDLDKYGWAMKMTRTSSELTIVDGSPVLLQKFVGEFYLLAPGYGFTDVATEYLEKFTFHDLTLVVSAAPEWSLSGYLFAEPNTRQPAGWPAAVDWSAANPLFFSGKLIRERFSGSTPGVIGAGRLYGTIGGPIPDASTLVLFGTGLLPAIRLLRRR